MEIIPNWHPIFVHFTVALVLMATLCALASKVLSGSAAEQSVIVARWMLVIAAFITVLTIVAGYFAFNSVNHDDTSHEVMLEHRNLAFGTFPLILIAAVLFYVKRAASAVSILALLFSVAASAMVVSTAWHGGELVYRYGLGVKSLPKASNHQHAGGAAHTHADSAEHSHDAAEQHSHDEGEVAHSHDDQHSHDKNAMDAQKTTAPAEGGDAASMDAHSHDEPAHQHEDGQEHQH